MTTYPQAQGQQSWDIGGDGGNSFAFDQIGASVTGTIEQMQEVQQTDLDSGEPRTFTSGQPMMMYRLTLRTTQRDATNPMDDGRRDVYLKGSRKAETQSSLAAVLQAVKLATGGTNLQPGATVTLTYIGDGQATSRGKNAPKLYTATYVPPAMNLGGPQQAHAAPQQTYQPQAAYQPQVQQGAPQQAYQPQAQQPAYQPQVQQAAYQPQAAQAAPQQAYQAPAQQAPAQQAPVQQAAPAAQQWPWTPEQLAAVRASGVDPATVWPEAWATYTANGGQ